MKNFAENLDQLKEKFKEKKFNTEPVAIETGFLLS